MKKILTLLCVMASMIMVSCQSNPKNYTEEIEDAVRFQLAVVSSIAVCDDSDDYKEMFTWMMDLAEKNNMREGSYREMLVEKSSDSFCAKVLDLYDSQDVVLSELQATQNEHVWTFTELNTSVRFTFELIPAQSGETYYRCSANEEDLRKQIIKSLKKVFWDALEESLE